MAEMTSVRENAAKEFMRQYELHYGLRLRFYVEGATESEALQYVFQNSGFWMPPRILREILK